MREIKIEGLDEVQEMLKEYREGGALELQQYREIGTIEECRDARERQKGKKPILSTPCKSINYYLCPDCGEILRINRPFCSECGSAIDWSDTP